MLETDIRQMLQLVSSHLSVPSQVEKLQMQLSNAMDVEESLLSDLDNAGMKIKILDFEVDELQAQLDKVSSEKKDLRLQIAELNSRLETVPTLHIIQFSQQRFQVDNINCFYCPIFHFTIF
jgi:predicted nuclease with TOPRIM domain